MPKLDGIRSIDELTLAHQRVLIRADFDVPLTDSGDIASDELIRAALPTIQKAIAEGARVVLAAHLGAPGGQKRGELSLERVGGRLAELLGQEVYFPDECVGDAARKVVSDLRGGQVCLLENLRFFADEERGDDGFARRLATLCDVYVGEAFSAAHRAHASLWNLPRLKKERGMGYRLKAELEALSRVADNPERPFVALLGGRLTEKVEVFETLLRRASTLCLGGEVANTLMAARSVDMKGSAVEPEQLALGRALLSRARDRGVELVMPLDFVIAGGPHAMEARVVSAGAIPDGHGAYDIGPRTIEAFAVRLAKAKTVFWSGPLGFVENPAFHGGTTGVARALADSAAFGIVGGDSGASLATVGADIIDRMGFISTGGVASLELIEGKKLPGVEALRG